MSNLTNIFIAIALVFFPNITCAQEYIGVPNPTVQLIDDIDVAVLEPGVIELIAVKEGSVVGQDQVIANLNSRQYELELEAANSELAVAAHRADNEVDMLFAKASEEVSRAVHQRSLKAVEKVKRSVSLTELDQLRLELEKAKLSYQQAEREQELARLQEVTAETQSKIAQLRLERRTIKSPIDGMVVEIKSNEGEWLQAGQPIVRIIRIDRLRIHVQADAAIFDQAFIGNEVIFSTRLPRQETETEFKGKVVFVSPITSEDSSFVQLKAEVENPEGKLRPGVTGNLKIKMPAN